MVNKQLEASVLMNNLESLTMQSFLELSPLPLMRVLDDGSVLYSNKPAQDLFDQFSIDYLWNIPRSWMPGVEQALHAGKFVMTVHEDDQVYDLMMVSIDNLCVNIYAYDVTEWNRTLTILEQHHAAQLELTARYARELSEVQIPLRQGGDAHAWDGGKNSILTQGGLSDLSNQHSFNRQLHSTVLRCLNTNTELAVIKLGLHDFQRIRTQLNFDHTNQLLDEMANRLKGCLRFIDVVAYMGDSMFAGLVEDFSSESDVHKAAQSIELTLTRPYRVGHHTIRPNLSIGISTFPRLSTSIQTLLLHADQAMEQASQAGGGYMFYHPESLADQSSDEV